jgi:hypothetical protein
MLVTATAKVQTSLHSAPGQGRPMLALAGTKLALVVGADGRIPTKMLPDGSMWVPVQVRKGQRFYAPGTNGQAAHVMTDTVVWTPRLNLHTTYVEPIILEGHAPPPPKKRTALGVAIGAVAVGAGAAFTVMAKR